MKSLRLLPAVWIFMTAALHAGNSTHALYTIDVAKMSRGKSICIGQPIQFVDTSTLVALIGSTSECWRDLPSEEIITFSLQGQLIARKPWPSTYSLAIILGARLVLTDSGGLTVFDRNLTLVQSVPYPSVPRMGVELRGVGLPTLTIFPGNARPPTPSALAGDPLRLELLEGETNSRHWPLIGDGAVLRWNEGKLVRSRNGVDERTFDIPWLTDCNHLCRAWTGVQIANVSLGKYTRALLIAKGSKIPITDSGGLFPFTRILVIDLTSGKILFQQEFLSRQDKRNGAVSLDGSLIALSDEHHVVITSLPTTI
jgi:hypothetical protein